MHGSKISSCQVMLFVWKCKWRVLCDLSRPVCIMLNILVVEKDLLSL